MRRAVRPQPCSSVSSSSVTALCSLPSCSPSQLARSPTTPTAAQRSIAVFTEQSPSLQRIGRARGYNSQVWLEDTDARSFSRFGVRLRQGELPVTTTIVKPQQFFNVDQLSRAEPPHPVGAPHRLDSEKPIGGLVAHRLLEAAEERGHSAHWWMPMYPGMSTQLANERDRPMTVYCDTMTTLFNLDQFENAADVAARLSVSPSSRNVSHGSDMWLANDAKLTGMAECRRILREAVIERGYRTGVPIPTWLLRNTGLSLKVGANPILYPPSASIREQLTLFNVEEIEEGYAFARRSGADIATADHVDLISGKGLHFVEETLGSDAFKFGSRLWAFKPQLESAGLVPKPGAEGHFFLPPHHAQRYGLHVFTPEELVEPHLFWTSIGMLERGAKWATKSGLPPPHIAAVLDRIAEAGRSEAGGAPPAAGAEPHQDNSGVTVDNGDTAQPIGTALGAVMADAPASSALGSAAA